MAQVASAINSLSCGLITIPASTLAYLVNELQSLKAEITAIRSSNEAAIEIIHSNVADDRKRITNLEDRAQGSSLTPEPGKKTVQRIAAIDQILKTRGPVVLKEICRLLNILPQEMSRILKRLDKRRYELVPRPGDRRFKVLRIRAWSSSS